MVLITKHNWKKLTSCIYNKLRIKAIRIYFTRILQALEIQYDVIYYAGYKIFMSVIMHAIKKVATKLLSSGKRNQNDNVTAFNYKLKPQNSKRSRKAIRLKQHMANRNT